MSTPLPYLGSTRQTKNALNNTMLINQLFEDAESDARRSRLADDVFQSALSYLYKLDKQDGTLPTTVLGGKNIPCLPAEDYDAPGIFSDMIFVFQPNEYAMGGQAVKMKHKVGGRYTYFVLVGVEGPSLKEIIKSLRYERVDQVVRHELQHILDYKRFKGDVLKSREPNFKVADGGIKPSERNDDERRDYHNSSAETNAYFHNMAEPLLQRIRFMQKHGADMVGIFSPLERDFRAYLAANLKINHGILKRHWDNLTEENKRKVLSRLSKLFDLYWQMAAKYTDNPEEVTTNV